MVEGFLRLPVAAVADSMNRFNVMEAEIKPFFSGVKMAGAAVTVREMVGCNLMLHKALYVAQPGDVIVVDARGARDISIGGGIICLAAVQQGIRGIVVDGAWRDVVETREMRFPVFARTTTPAGPHKGWAGDINLPIQCGGVPVAPGDIVVGDDGGVAVVPRGQAEAILERAQAIVAREEEVRRQVQAGRSTLEIYGFEERLKAMGVEIL